MNLPSLKKLELTCLGVDDNFISTIIMGCPNLEELVMSCCILDVYEICSDKLKKLVLNMCVQMWDVHISCPAVVSLRIKYLRKGGIRLHNVSPLARADICFQDAVLDDSIGKYLYLLSDLSNVASLRLHTTCRALQALLVAHVPKWRSFENLRTLELGPVDMKRDANFVYCFLQQAPNLKKIILQLTAPSKEATNGELFGNYSILREYFETIVIRIICTKSSSLLEFSPSFDPPRPENNVQKRQIKK
ncbi:hypothetical protein FCM35_KLT08803 [Carex littledalei]|uniref:At1g61320/AtMIF1 LRR domain-containing protein n=1 Tax=Carex littledalei TaxID=544730 RepID=A0A833VJP3_9POAL|nr:hypothetical protein FCM35_KLT08803 [Carex littledalei]